MRKKKVEKGKRRKLNVPTVLKNLVIASNPIEKHNANKNTPLISAPNTSALCHP